MTLEQKIKQQLDILIHLNESAIEVANKSSYPIVKNLNYVTSQSCMASITSLQWVLSEIEKEDLKQSLTLKEITKEVSVPFSDSYKEWIKEKAENYGAKVIFNKNNEVIAIQGRKEIKLKFLVFLGYAYGQSDNGR